MQLVIITIIHIDMEIWKVRSSGDRKGEQLASASSPKKKKKLASAKPCCSAASAELACRDALSKRQQISREREERKRRGTANDQPDCNSGAARTALILSSHLSHGFANCSAASIATNLVDNHHPWDLTLC